MKGLHEAVQDLRSSRMLKPSTYGARSYPPNAAALLSVRGRQRNLIGRNAAERAELLPVKGVARRADVAGQVKLTRGKLGGVFRYLMLWASV
jgi:hypothetical protein